MGKNRKNKKKGKKDFLVTENRNFLVTESGAPILTEGNEKSIAQIADIPAPDQKQPTFRVPYNLMEMQTEYKDQFVDSVILGINLTVAEDRHIFTMSKLLHHKSEHKDESSPDFYLGNTEQDETTVMQYQLANNRQIISQNMPSYVVPQQEYYETYLGGKPGGDNIKKINQGLDSLAQRSFGLRVPVPVGKNKHGEKIYDYYEGTDHLFKVVKVARGVTETDITKIDKGDDRLRKEKGEFIFKLHPIFRHHIQNNYVNLPLDIYERIVEAAGGHIRYITPAIIALRNYLFMQLRNMRQPKRGEDNSFEINTDNLYSLLRLKNKLKKDKKRAIEAKNKTVQTFVNLGLVLHVQEVIGAEGQPKHIFTLNKDFA